MTTKPEKAPTEVTLIPLATFPSCDRKLGPLTLTSEYDLDSVKMNQRDKYPRQKTHTHTHTHTVLTALPGPLKQTLV